MIANLLNTLVGLVLAYVVVLDSSWVEHRYFPFLAFAAIIFVLALWARRSDPQRWFSNVTIAMAIWLAVLSLFPLEVMPSLTFWGGFWVGSLVPTVSLWAALYRRDINRGLIKSEHIS